MAEENGRKLITISLAIVILIAIIALVYVNLPEEKTKEDDKTQDDDNNDDIIPVGEEILSIIYYIAKKIENIPYKFQNDYTNIKWQEIIKENVNLKNLCKDRNIKDVDSIRTELLKLKRIILKTLKDLTDHDAKVLKITMDKVIKKRIMELNESVE